MLKDSKKRAKTIRGTRGLPNNSRPILICATIVVAFLAALFNISRAIHCWQNTGCVDPYWASFWLISYSDGYERRALLGQVVRFFSDTQLSYIALNVAALIIVICVITYVYSTFFPKISKNKAWPIAFLILVSGPTSTVFFEVLGDPLHVAMGLAFAYFVVANRIAALPHSLTLALASTVTLIAVMIHEASIFLILPVIYLHYCFSNKKRPGYSFLTTLIIILTIGVVLFLNVQEPTAPGLALTTNNSTEFFAPYNTMPSLIDLLKFEFFYYFGSVEGPIRLVFKILGAFLWPVMALLAIGLVFKTQKIFRIFIFLLLPTLPLYSIAHDWGRFAIYTLCFSLVLYGIFPEKRSTFLPFFILRISKTSFHFARLLFSSTNSMIILIPLFYSHPSYRISGLTEHSVVLCIVAITAFIASYFLLRQSDGLKTKPPEKNVSSLQSDQS